MPEVYYHRKEISYEHLKALLSKLSSADFGDLHIFSYGSTFKSYSDIRVLENRFEGGVNLLYSGSMFGGLMRLIPLPKARVFSFELKDHSKILDLFFALNEFLWIHYLFVSEVDYEKVKGALSSNHAYLRSAEGILESGFVVYSVHMDAWDFDDGSGIAEQILANKPTSRDALAVFGAQ